MKFASRALQLSSTSRSKSKASESLLVSELESLVSYLRSVKILALSEDRKAMKYAKQVRGPIRELSTACKTSRIYTLDDVTT